MISALVYIFFCFIMDASSWKNGNWSCGKDNSKTSMVYEGIADIETYPWLGTLYYPAVSEKSEITTAVILVTKQIVIGYAKDIDRLPKEDVRARSRVILGRKCEAGPSIKIRDYAFHPDYNSNSYSALAMVQLDVDWLQRDIELRPICPPPGYLKEPEIYALTPGDCRKGKIRIYKMTHVSNESCMQFYRRSKWNSKKYWPTRTVCARAQTGGQCKWRSGTALVLKMGSRWKLLGFGMGGPGCDSPSIFLDYTMHVDWVRTSIARIGHPAITRVAPNHLIMRRTTSSLQRYGPCDIEETEFEIFTDQIELSDQAMVTRATYNLTLISKVEYTCIILKMEKTPFRRSGEEARLAQWSQSAQTPDEPKVYIRRWCSGPPQVCYDYQYLDIQFYLDLVFVRNAKFSIAAYGKTAKVIDVQETLNYLNRKIKQEVPDYDFVLKTLSRHDPYAYNWFSIRHVGEEVNIAIYEDDFEVLDKFFSATY